MIPINIEETRVDLFTNTLNCQRGHFPITYLGIPLGTQKPRVEHLMLVVRRLEKRLAGIAKFLIDAGRLVMVKYVLSSLAMYIMTCIDLPETIKQQISKYLRHCLWRGSN